MYQVKYYKPSVDLKVGLFKIKGNKANMMFPTEVSIDEDSQKFDKVFMLKRTAPISVL